MGKGTATHDRILDTALRLAGRDGLEGLSIGGLASELGLSKSGLFAHFGSKEELQIQVLEEASERFRETVIRPAFKAPRGEPRIWALLDRWLAWGNDPAKPGGCIFVTAAVELDDRPGPARDYLEAAQKQWLADLARSARLAIEMGHFRPDADPEQFAFEFYALALGFHHARRMLRDPAAESRFRAAFERLISSFHSS
jgi:AcrR family transcriptional regulator